MPNNGINTERFISDFKEGLVTLDDLQEHKANHERSCQEHGVDVSKTSFFTSINEAITILQQPQQ